MFWPPTSRRCRRCSPTATSPSTGAPALEGALVNFDGEISHIHEVGSHSIFFAELRGIRLNGERSNGLAYFNRAYHQLGASAPAP